MVLRALPNEVMETMEHITGEEQVGGRYPALRNALTESYGHTPARKHAQLISLTREGALGDRKPTEFLMYMRNLSGERYETWERANLLNALPSEVRCVLFSSNAANNNLLLLLLFSILGGGLMWRRNLRLRTYCF